MSQKKSENMITAWLARYTPDYTETINQEFELHDEVKEQADIFKRQSSATRFEKLWGNSEPPVWDTEEPTNPNFFPKRRQEQLDALEEIKLEAEEIPALAQPYTAVWKTNKTVKLPGGDVESFIKAENSKMVQALKDEPLRRSWSKHFVAYQTYMAQGIGADQKSFEAWYKNVHAE